MVAQPRGILRFNGSAQALVKRVGAIATEALSVKHRVGGGPRVKGLNHEIPAASPAALLPMVRTQVQGAGSWYEEAPTQASPPHATPPSMPAVAGRAEKALAPTAGCRHGGLTCGRDDHAARVLVLAKRCGLGGNRSRWGGGCLAA